MKLLSLDLILLPLARITLEAADRPRAVNGDGVVLSVTVTGDCGTIGRCTPPGPAGKPFETEVAAALVALLKAIF